MRKPVHEMTGTELLDEQRRREENRRLGRPLTFVAPEEIAAAVEQLERDARVHEKEEQRAIRKMAIAIGFRVYWLSQARETKQTPGIPDLWLSLEAIGFAAWWETKRQVGGQRSTAQEEFAQECIAARIPYGFGDRYEFAQWLARHGFTAPPIPE
ncbi:MAG: hypothetical protein ABIY52_12480 [Gemmatimonadaceae bacterium]